MEPTESRGWWVGLRGLGNAKGWRPVACGHGRARGRADVRPTCTMAVDGLGVVGSILRTSLPASAPGASPLQLP